MTTPPTEFRPIQKIATIPRQFGIHPGNPRSISSREDAILQVSRVLNHNAPRLGDDSPQEKTEFRMMDCTDVSDFAWPFLSEETHQYYRLSARQKRLNLDRQARAGCALRKMTMGRSGD